MIRAAITKKDGEYRLTIKGHSGAAPRGADLICAAATVSAYQLAQIAREMHAAGKLTGEPTVLIRDGRAKVRLRPTPEADAETQHTLYVVGTGLRILAANYQRHITFDDSGLTA